MMRIVGAQSKVALMYYFARDNRLVSPKALEFPYREHL